VESVRVVIVLREEDLGPWAGRLDQLAERAVAAGIDHLAVGDHVSFADGHGADGLIQAAPVLAADPHVHVQTGVYLLALRHPAVVARQLATIALLARAGSRSEPASVGTIVPSSSRAGSTRANGALARPKRCAAYAA
jgi:Luciferase-like monooxygenase